MIKALREARDEVLDALGPLEAGTRPTEAVDGDAYLMAACSKLGLDPGEVRDFLDELSDLVGNVSFSPLDTVLVTGLTAAVAMRASKPEGSDSLDWEAIGKAGAYHKIREEILLHLLRVSEASPTTTREVIKQSLGNTSYHYKTLLDWGFVEESKTEPRRGALEHFYVLTDKAWKPRAKPRG